MASHLTLEEREILAHMKREKKSLTEIARRLGRSKSTVSREVKRNRSRNGYWAAKGQAKAEARRSNRSWTAKLKRRELRKYVCDRLRQRWSPDEIAARSKMEFPDQWRKQISHQSIYDWIKAQGKADDRWRRFLRRGGRKRPKPENCGKIPAGASIEGRPPIVDRRQRFGDWEGDTVVGAGRHGGVVTLVERKSGYVMLAGVEDLKAPTVRQAASDLYAAMPDVLRKTLTLDNGKEFAEHEQLAKQTNLDIYFAKPYCAWQRGTNENTNGLFRQFFPKGTDLARVRQAALAKVQRLLNNRPRKRLGYKTPCEVLLSRLHVAFEI
jgi:transposase, IS30 family